MTPIMEIKNLTIEKAEKLLREKKISSFELTKAYIEKIKKEDGKIHAFLGLAEKEALKQAKEADLRLKDGKPLSPLDGIPLAIKDNISTYGLKTMAGSKILENFVAPYDATAIKRLKGGGAIILGKTNLDEFAMGSSTENSAFGPTRNPRDLEKVPGGSSGGSAAAVAADFCLGALGSETGGSVRQPASFCGVVGLKPTYGRISRYGLLALASSLDQIGIFAKTVYDCALILETICGHDSFDATTVPRKKFEAKKIKEKKKLKIGLPKEYFGKGLDPKIREIILKEIEKLKKEGHKIKEISLPHSDKALACYYIIQPAEASSNLARYDGIRYGHSAKADNLLGVYLKSREEGFGAEVKRRIMLGTYTLSAGYYDAYYLQAQKVRTKIIEDFAVAFEEVDVLITPTTPTFPFKIGEKSNDPLEMYLSDILTVSANLAGIPALSIPVGNPTTGLQIMGPQFSESIIMGLGAQIEKI